MQKYYIRTINQFGYSSAKFRRFRHNLPQVESMSKNDNLLKGGAIKDFSRISRFHD